MTSSKRYPVEPSAYALRLGGQYSSEYLGNSVRVYREHNKYHVKGFNQYLGTRTFWAVLDTWKQAKKVYMGYKRLVYDGRLKHLQP